MFALGIKELPLWHDISRAVSHIMWRLLAGENPLSRKDPRGADSATDHDKSRRGFLFLGCNSPHAPAPPGSL